MGLDFDGAICEEIWVPRDAIISVNQNSNLSSQMIAYLEPVAASAAPLKKLLKPSKVLVIGDNRIAKLTVLILNTSGHEAIMCSEKDLHSITSNSYEYVIETVLTEDVITHISRILIDNGTWLLKRRKKTLTSFTSMDFIAKEITISCINYLDFHKSLEWMESNYENLKDLLGNSYSLSNWSDAFKEARLSETKKIFIEIS